MGSAAETMRPDALAPAPVAPVRLSRRWNGRPLRGGRSRRYSEFTCTYRVSRYRTQILVVRKISEKTHPSEPDRQNRLMGQIPRPLFLRQRDSWACGLRAPENASRVVISAAPLPTHRLHIPSRPFGETLPTA
jgi:hypothetical protein